MVALLIGEKPEPVAVMIVPTGPLDGDKTNEGATVTIAVTTTLLASVIVRLCAPAVVEGMVMFFAK